MLSFLNKENIKNVIEGSVRSYSLIFFSDSRIFSLIVFLVTFFNYSTGISGLISVFVSNFTALILGYDKYKISRGLYGFNSLIVGLGIGYYYNFNSVLFTILIFASIVTLFVTVSLEGILFKYYLPYMSYPFIIVFWIVYYTLHKIKFVEFNQSHIYVLNSIYSKGGIHFVEIYQYLDKIIFPSLKMYFISLSSIFFQYSLIGGILIAIGLIFYSRISFVLSFIGFYTAYFFYMLIGMPINESTFTYIAFNYILISIGVGGYFLIASRMSFLWSILIIPVTVFIAVGIGELLYYINLPSYTISFNVSMLVFLYALKNRIYPADSLSLSYLYTNSPEKNLYLFSNAKFRFKNKRFYSLKLPFIGKWFVSQGENGKYTHKNRWRYAWDFMINDETGKTYKGNGLSLNDYFCFNKAVTSPADGIIEKVLDGIPDNNIGDVNTDNNWGNTIVIKHDYKFYSQLSHLKLNSIKVRPGDHVKAGHILAHCGNSGRSPEPHLHFQLQSEPEIGSETLNYPLGHYLVKNNGFTEFKDYNRPIEGETVFNHEENQLLVDAFHFIPGQKLLFEYYQNNEDKKTEEWEVITNIYNYSYFKCKNSDTYAYFSIDNGVFFFYDFYGDRNSLLYYFFLACYKVPLGFYENLKVEDSIALHLVFKKSDLFLQDFISPFYTYLYSKYSLNYYEIDNSISPSKIILQSFVSMNSTMFKKTKTLNEVRFDIEIDTKGINKIKIVNDKNIIIAECLR